MRVHGMDALAARLAGTADLPFEPVFHPIAPAPGPPCAAVDGSHAVLADTGSLWVVAVRAAAVAWPRDGAVPPDPDDTRTVGALPAIQLLATTVDAAEHEVAAAYAQHGLPAPAVRSAEAFAEAHRALAELVATTQAFGQVPEGGLVLVDGALSQLPPAAQAIAERLLDRATASGVHVAGISKRSGLSAAGVPLIPAVDEAGRRRHPDASWWAPIPGNTAVVARLHPRADHAFRIDAETQALPWLADMSRDAVYLGYPYPLAKVHNLVAITRAEARRLRESLARRLGPDAARLQDFHAVLDRNVPR